MSAPRSGPRLAGVRVVVTRAAHQAPATARAFEAAGADVALLPLLEVVPPDDPEPLETALTELPTFAWVVFTSSNAVDRVVSHPGWPPERPPGLEVASVGGATSRALRAAGLEPDLEAAEPRAEGLAAALAPRLRPASGGPPRILLPQAADARPALEAELSRAGARVERVDAYAKRLPPGTRERAQGLFGDGPLGWVTFTSPSTARNFAALWTDAWPTRRVGLLPASIGPVTSAALRHLGAPPAAEAEHPEDEALVAAVVRVVERSGDGPG